VKKATPLKTRKGKKPAKAKVEAKVVEGAVRPSSAPKGTSIVTLLEQKAMNPALSQADLARINNVSQAAISMMFKRYGVNDKYLESFKTHRADIFAGIQDTILKTLTATDIKKASVRDRVIAAATLYDKERLERGQSTSNVSVLFQVAEAAEDLQRKPLETVAVTPSVTLEAAMVDDGSDNS